MIEMQLSFDDLPPAVVEFADPAYRHNDLETAVAAAGDAARHASADRVLALLTLAQHPAGLTDFELADLTGKQQTSIGKRRGECVAQGLVMLATAHDGTRGEVIIKRPTPSGSKAAVWILTLAGRDWLRQNGYLK